MFHKFRNRQRALVAACVILSILAIWLYVASTFAPPPNHDVQVVVLSSSRPSATDYVAGIRARLGDTLVVHDTDVPDAAIQTKVTRAASLWQTDRHHDSKDRVTTRSKTVLDYASALRRASVSPLPLTLFLESDVALTHNFVQRLRDIPREGDWFAWTLFYGSSSRTWHHGDVYDFGSCTQAMLYHTRDLGALADYLESHYRDDPNDWAITKHIASTGRPVRVAVPSMVQHLGLGADSTMHESRAQRTGCWAGDFVP